MLCLTFDIDWALDDVIRDTMEVLAPYDGPATWFVTHATPMVEELAARWEVGVHPNFNPVLEGGGADLRGVLAGIREIAPKARVVRSHSLTRSSRLSTLLRDEGFTHESNYLVPARTAPSMLPWRDFSGLTQVPIRWEDDVRLRDDSHGEPVEQLGEVALLTVDFHPIHVFLNTTSFAEYEAARPFKDVEALRRLRRPAGSGGTRDRLIALLESARRANVRRVSVGELEPEAS